MSKLNYTINGVDLESTYVKHSEYSLIPAIYSKGYLPNTLIGLGLNNYGQLGDGTVVDKSISQIGSLTNWKEISTCNSVSHAIKSDGTLWSWGRGNDGQIGDGTVNNYSSPVQIGSLTNWAKIFSGYNHTLALKTDGTLWGWGGSNEGQLGNGNLTPKSSPVQIGSLTNWIDIGGNSSSSLGLKSDGTLWSWGYDSWGSLGLGTHEINYSTPTQIGVATNWKTLQQGSYSQHAIKTDGTLWGWGYNVYGGIGTGDVLNKSTPVQIGSLTNWKQIAGGKGVGVIFAIKTDGTLWAWGQNDEGQLGLGDTVHRSSPVQIGSMTNWKQVTGSYNTAFAIKTDGTLWGWGTNYNGYFGSNNISNNYSSPVQIGTLNTWQYIKGGDTGYTFLALKY